MPRADAALRVWFRPAHRRWRRRHRPDLSGIVLAVAAIAVGAAVVALFVSQIPHWWRLAEQIPDPKDRIAAETGVVQNAAQIAGGAIVLAGLYFTWRTVHVSQEAQLTERFNKAIDHLGSQSLETRLGGIFALARIARDSRKDHWAVMQVFCAYVRENSRKHSGTAPPADIQAILGVVRDRESGYETEDQVLDFSGASLAGADFRFADLRRANLEDAALTGADLFQADLRDANLAGADLRHGHLRETRLDAANLSVTNLEDATLRAASLRGAGILATNFKGCTLIGADLTGCVYATRSQFESAVQDDSTILPEFATGSAHHA